ncbi:thioester reductase domain-containing protein [Streptodolium elevatio]|uniref:Thioester reductase domain-containing protein n=1 Tax=Streptodolium elevatio TaxID=3157996 RepID=A0ABV3DMX0_9ACTN
MNRLRAPGADLTTGPGAGLGAGPSTDVGNRLSTDIVLAPDIRPVVRNRPRTAPDRRVLLTGATGFLGAFLLRELLDRTPDDVWCLVRADTPQQARQRIQDTMRRYLLWDSRTAARIVPVPGDLTRPRLGLPPRQWARLAERVDVIQHSGARVSHIAPYGLLRDANVRGTAEVLRLACADHTKPVHFVSTAAVGADPAGGPPPRGTAGAGYVTSKWAAERLVSEAGERGVPVRIYRPGRISGHSVTGACQVDDAVWNLIRAVVLLGAAPNTADAEVSFAPVDYVARAIVRMSAPDSPDAQGARVPPGTPVTAVAAVTPVAPDTPGTPAVPGNGLAARVRYLLNPSRMPLHVLLAHVAERFPVETVPSDVWLARLWDARHRQDGALARAALLLPSYRALLTGAGRPPTGDLTAGIAGPDDAGAPCPPIDGRLIAVYLDYFESVGFLPSGAPQFLA